MQLRGTKYPFNAHNIAHAPAEHGVVMLWDNDEMIYVGRTQGRAATIRSVLLDHWSGFCGPCTKESTHFSWEKCNQRAAREVELVERFVRERSRMPRCRER